jgi:hypothetical protein
LEALVDDGRLVGNANLDALRTEFPFLLRFDRRLAGPGAGLLDPVVDQPHHHPVELPGEGSVANRP